MEISIQEIREGNSKTFEKVYALYHTKLYFYVLKYTQSAYLSEETVQLTFIRMWENRQQLSLLVDLSRQVFRIAQSTMIDLLRKEGSYTRQHTVPAEAALSVFVEMDTVHKDELRRLQTLVEDLSPARKTIFKLSRFEELSHKEIAQQLSISPKTVENHIGRALRQLKDKLLLLF